MTDFREVFGHWVKASKSGITLIDNYKDKEKKVAKFNDYQFTTSEVAISMTEALEEIERLKREKQSLEFMKDQQIEALQDKIVELKADRQFYRELTDKLTNKFPEFKQV